MSKKSRACGITSIVLGGLLLIGGIVFHFVIPSILELVLKKQVPLIRGSKTLETWMAPPFPIRMEFWIFNILNPTDVLYSGSTPVFQEIGPFVYRETQEKYDVEWCKDKKWVTENGTIVETSTSCKNGWLRYRNKKIYDFLTEESNNLDPYEKQFYVPNIVYFLIYNLLKNTKELSCLLSNSSSQIGYEMELFSVLTDEWPIMTSPVSADDLIFQGYDDKLLDVIAILGKYNVTLSPATKDLPKRMGIFVGKNGTDDGLYVIDTGENELKHLGRIEQWNGGSVLGKGDKALWSNFYGNNIVGTDGTVFHPFVKKSDTLELFVSDICRSLFAEYESETSLGQVPGLRFVVPGKVFDANNPNNIAFCVEQAPPCNPVPHFFNASCHGDPHYQEAVSHSIQVGQTNKTCLLSGFLDIGGATLTDCLRDDSTPLAPIVMSSPHFLFVDECAREAVGLAPPDKEVYQAAITVEPITGTGIQFHRRLQVNVKMPKDPMVKSLRGLKDSLIMPVVWLNESATADDGTLHLLYVSAVLPFAVVNGLAYAAIALGAFVLVITGLVFLFARLNLQPSMAQKYLSTHHKEEPTEQLNGTARTAPRHSPNSSSHETSPVVSSQSRPREVDRREIRRAADDSD